MVRANGQRIRRAARRAAAVAAVAAGAGTAVAGAAHWPQLGGDGGRSGYQPVDEGGLPVPFRYRAADAGIRTPIVITAAGPTETPRVAFGTQSGGGPPADPANGFVRLRELATGAPVGPEGGVDVDDEVPGFFDADTFGDPGLGAGVAPVDSSTSAGLGQLYVVHNDDNQVTTDDPNPGRNDVAIAQIDEPTGAKRQDVSVGGTDGYSVQSSPLLTAPDAGGTRLLFFVIADGAGSERLVKVTVAQPGADGRSALTFAATADIDANPLASPAAVVLRDPGSLVPVPMVAVAAAPSSQPAAGDAAGIRTFRQSSLAAGPRSGDLGGATFTPSVPVGPDGASPALTPLLYAASAQGEATVVRKLVQSGDDPGLLVAADGAATSPALAGAPAPALALAQLAPGGLPAPGRVIATTAANLYSLDTENLAGQPAQFAPAPLAAGTGFGRTIAAVSRELVYVTRDGGAQLVLNATTAQRVPLDASGFLPATTSVDATASIGQPAISRGFVAFAADNGLYVYRNDDETPPTVTVDVPDAGARVSGRATLAATARDNRGLAQVEFLLDGAVIAREPARTPDQRSFQTVLDTLLLANGRHVLTVAATDTATPVAPGDDGPNRTLSAAREIVIDNQAAPPRLDGPALPPALKPRLPRLTIRVRPRRDLTHPRRFTVTGLLGLPPRVTAAAGCTGRVTLTVKRGISALATRRAAVGRDCRFGLRVTLRNRRALRRARTLRVLARFDGNAVLKPRRAPAVRVRVR